MNAHQTGSSKENSSVTGGNLLNFIEKRIAEGIPISVVYNGLKDNFHSKKALLSVFGLCCPDRVLKKKYNLLNLLLWVNLFGILVLHVNTAFSIYAQYQPGTPMLSFVLRLGYHIIIPVLLLYPLTQLYKFRAYLYLGVIYLGFSCVFVNFVEHEELQNFLIFTAPWVVAISLALIILKKVFPHYHLFKGLDTEALEKELTSR